MQEKKQWNIILGETTLFAAFVAFYFKYWLFIDSLYTVNSVRQRVKSKDKLKISFSAADTVINLSRMLKHSSPLGSIPQNLI